MSKFWGRYGQHADYSSQNYTVYLKFAKRVDVKSSHHTHTQNVTI